MRIHFKSVAACAVAMVVVLAFTTFGFFQLAVNPDFSGATSQLKGFPSIVHTFSAAAQLWLIASIAGAWMWIIMFASRRSGVHRLAQVSTAAKHPY